MRSVLRLFGKCFCVLIPLLIIWIYIWKNPLVFLDNEAPYYLWNKDKTNNAQGKKYEVLILGDSIANAAYVPEFLSDDTLNLALGGASPIESYYVMYEWLLNNPAPKVCYISFNDPHFQGDEVFWQRIMYSHRFPVRYNTEILCSGIKYKEPSILRRNYLIDFISYELYLPNKYITGLMNASFNQRYHANVQAWRRDELHYGRYMAIGTKEHNRPVGQYLNFTVIPIMDDYYRRLLSLCQEHNIQVRILKIPVPSSQSFTANYIRDFNQYYEQIKADYPQITVDWIPTYEMRLFNDDIHLNSHGALQFSAEIRERYSEDFECSGISSSQILAINDSIERENKIEWILKWIYGKDYTVLLWDKQGIFPKIYRDFMKDMQEDLKICIPVNGLHDIYYISGINSNLPSDYIAASKDCLEIQISESETQRWNMPSEDVLSVMVIDNYNETMVCTKDFQYMDRSFVLIQ